jgi:hypothetical protein
MLTNNFDLRPSLDDSPGVSFAPAKKVRARETGARKAPPDTTSSFDDTFREIPSTRQRRLRESQPWQFQRGVPTNDKTSAQNYNDDEKLIDGEHKTLLALGKINEAVEGDDHDGHIYKHRLQLSDPKLSETQRMGLMEHISNHIKMKGKKLKAIQKEAKGQGKDSRPDISRNKGYGHGVGMLSRALPANTYDVIPQDQQVDVERKRTAGNQSMESREARIKQFGRAVKRSYGTRRSL